MNGQAACLEWGGVVFGCVCAVALEALAYFVVFFRAFVLLDRGLLRRVRLLARRGCASCFASLLRRLAAGCSRDRVCLSLFLFLLYAFCAAVCGRSALARDVAHHPRQRSRRSSRRSPAALRPLVFLDAKLRRLRSCLLAIFFLSLPLRHAACASDRGRRPTACSPRSLPLPRPLSPPGDRDRRRPLVPLLACCCSRSHLSIVLGLLGVRSLPRAPVPAASADASSGLPQPLRADGRLAAALLASRCRTLRFAILVGDLASSTGLQAFVRHSAVQILPARPSIPIAISGASLRQQRRRRLGLDLGLA